jgi:hypothetical protein
VGRQAAEYFPANELELQAAVVAMTDRSLSSMNESSNLQWDKNSSLADSMIRCSLESLLSIFFVVYEFGAQTIMAM